jgi:hypothetical protein
MMKRIVPLMYAALSASCAGSFAGSDPIDDAHVDRDALSEDGLTLPTFALRLVADAEQKILSDSEYDPACLEYKLRYDPDEDQYVVSVVHSATWLRSNGHSSEADGEYEGGLNYCGFDVSFRYDRSGKYVEKVFQR